MSEKVSKVVKQAAAKKATTTTAAATAPVKTDKTATKAKKLTGVQKRTRRVNKKLREIVKASEKRLGSGQIRLKRSVNGTVKIAVVKTAKAKAAEKAAKVAARKQTMTSSDGAAVAEKKSQPKVTARPVSVRKPIGGEKNGGFRDVLTKKRPNYYPAVHKSHRRRIYRDQPHWNRKLPKVRASLTPGRVLILLAGKHRGKHVILLKVLKTGLLVISGPFRVNGCPIRRIHPNYVIATKTEMSMEEVKVPAHINNAYFRKDKDGRRKALKKERKERAEKAKDIFRAPKTKKKKAGMTLEQKKDQAQLDWQMMSAIKKRPDARVFFKYLKSRFGLKGTKYPHRLQF